MSLSINNWVHFNDTTATKNGDAFLADSYDSMHDAADVYRALGYNYMKFFKMDLLCKWAWLGAETLLQSTDGYTYDGIDKNKVAVVLQTKHGCIDVDKKYLETMNNGAPSPALFVYTLPNIMLGEISIRHGFKGEQLSTVFNKFNTKELHFWVSDLLNNRGMDACICGWADVYQDSKDMCLFWVTKENTSIPFSITQLDELYQL